MERVILKSVHGASLQNCGYGFNETYQTTLTEMKHGEQV